MTRKKTSRKKNTSKRRKTKETTVPGSFWLFISTRLFAGLVFSALVILLYIDAEIRQRFSGNIQSQPAHIYARPLQLQNGSSININQLEAYLIARGYKKSSDIREAGEFAIGNDALDIYLQAFDSGIYQQTEQAIRLKISNNRVSSIIDHTNGVAVSKFTFEPPLIGSLQLGSYKDRITLKLHQMPELLIKTLLTMEDRQFNAHIGVDPKAILRAIWSNLKSGKAVQGGSTLTQQLVKNLFLSPKRTFSRKITEALMAIMMEVRFSKSEILELYLNEIFLGQSGNRAVHGFALASEYYFGRPVEQLKLHETTMLVGMIPAPSFYNPRKHPQRAIDRRNLVLKTLAKVGAISEYTAQTMAQYPLDIVPHKTENTSNFSAYLDYLHRQLRQYYSEDVLRTNGLKLHTSLDAEIQNIAQNGLNEMLLVLEKQKDFNSGTLQGAVVVIDPRQGEILGLVGDRMKGYSGFNRAIDAERPIGSLIKPAVYLTALEQSKKYSLATILEDSPLTLTPEGGEPWSPQNYDKQFRGPIPLYQGLIKSYNLPTVRLGLELGVDNVIDTMQRLGIEREIQNYPSTLLGASQHTPLEIAQMYQSISNFGVRIPLRSILSIQNHRNETVARFPLSENRVIDQDSAVIINHALRMVVDQGTAAGLNRSFNSNFKLAGKTGTTDDFRDSWFAGYSHNFLMVVWVGRDDNKPIRLSGSAGAMRVWEKIMSQLSLSIPEESPNDNIIIVSIDPNSGLIANQRCLQQQELPFIQGSQPEAFAPCSGLAAKFKNWFRIKSEVMVDSIEVNNETRP